MSTATLTRPARPTTAPPRAAQVERRVRAVPHAPEPGLHLTRRGRVLVVLVLAAALLAIFALGRSGTSVASSETPLPAPLGVTTVESGETLWGVARRIAPDADVRRLVEQIRQLNHMGSSTLQVGQQLLLPVEA